MGSAFYPNPARAWQWRVEGGPCDQLLFATSMHVSYTVMGAGTDPRLTPSQNLTFNPTLSGDYTVTLTVTQMDGTTFTCTFVVHIRAPGFRVELCWDRTGQTDLDLWVHRPGNTTAWTSGGGLFGPMLANVTCGWSNCRNAVSPSLGWGYATTPGGACREPMGGNCNNPRLDIDNISTPGIPENINIDDPNAGDVFRVAVNFYGQSSGSGAVHPMVNIYCGGALQATYGGAMVGGTLYGSSPISGFMTPGQDGTGSLWRVVDVTMATPTTCTRREMVATGTTNPCVETNNNRTYNGANCALR
jgi:hypothetical protein